MVFCLLQRFGGFDQEKNIYESYLIVLDAVEQCLANVNEKQGDILIIMSFMVNKVKLSLIISTF